MRLVAGRLSSSSNVNAFLPEKGVMPSHTPFPTPLTPPSRCWESKVSVGTHTGVHHACQVVYRLSEGEILRDFQLLPSSCLGMGNLTRVIACKRVPQRTVADSLEVSQFFLFSGSRAKWHPQLVTTGVLSTTVEKRSMLVCGGYDGI